MTWAFLVGGALLVVCIGLFAVGSAVARTGSVAAPAVLEVEDVVAWLAERLPEEAAGQLSLDDVEAVVGWYLDYFSSVGLATEHGQELGDAALSDGTDRVVARLDDALDAVVARGLELPEPLDAVAVAVVVDLLGVYMAEMGAFGGPGQAPAGD